MSKGEPILTTPWLVHNKPIQNVSDISSRKRAIVYIAYGKEYQQEVLRSVDSVNGQYSCVVCRPGDWEDERVETIKLPGRQSDHWFLDRVRYFNLILNSPVALPYDQILLLDSDTYICGDLTDFFTILDRFDIAGTQAISQQTLQRDDIPASFPELHCGALAINCNEKIKRLFRRWLEIYQERPKYFGNDQPPLRQALWEMQDIKLGILPAEFCFRFRWGGLLARKVRVLHGKEHKVPYEQIAEEVNSEGGIRIYHRRELA